MKFYKPTKEEEFIGASIVNAAFKIHVALGPGLLEKIYESCMCHELRKAGFKVERQFYVPISYDGLEFDEGLRIDLLVDDKIPAEIKSVETVNPVWSQQLLSQLKLSGHRLGYLINFNVPLIKDGIRRIIV